jgi:hypothetical protein
MRAASNGLYGKSVDIGTMAITASSTSEEDRHTMHIGKSIGVHGRLVHGPIFAIKCPK